MRIDQIILSMVSMSMFSTRRFWMWETGASAHPQTSEEKPEFNSTSLWRTFKSLSYGYAMFFWFSQGSTALSGGCLEPSLNHLIFWKGFPSISISSQLSLDLISGYDLACICNHGSGLGYCNIVDAIPTEALCSGNMLAQPRRVGFASNLQLFP